jgi:membrane protein DedA with SNARE-associated domain
MSQVLFTGYRQNAYSLRNVTYTEDRYDPDLERRRQLLGIEEALVDFARDLYDAIGWPGVVFLMAVESACIPFPSEVIMPLAGWFLVKDEGHGLDYLLVAGFFGALGNTIGSLIAYYAGLLGGRPLLIKYGRYVLITPQEIDSADRWFQKYGELTVFVARLMPVIRTFISLPAGIARMNVVRFTIFTFAGAFIWSVGLAALGYVVGENWEDILPYFRPVSIPIAVIVLAAVGFWLYRRIREVRHAPIEEEPAAPL